jgi:hypothetical protein
MITPNLVELIEKGDAQYKTWTTGATGSARIPVPKNNYIVITDFHYSHFVDRTPDFENPEFDMAAVLKNVVHHLSFVSYGQNYLYTIRSSFRQQFWEGLNFITPSESDTKYDTYQVHRNDVHIDIWRLIDFENWIMTVSKLSDKTAEPANPAGYGTLNNTPNQNVLREIFFNGLLGDQFVPYGENQGIVLTQAWREQFFNAITNVSALNRPATESIDCNYSYPILNIGYVLVNKPADRKKR